MCKSQAIWTSGPRNTVWLVEREKIIHKLKSHIYFPFVSYIRSHSKSFLFYRIFQHYLTEPFDRNLNRNNNKKKYNFCTLNHMCVLHIFISYFTLIFHFILRRSFKTWTQKSFIYINRYSNIWSLCQVNHCEYFGYLQKPNHSHRFLSSNGRIYIDITGEIRIK